MLYDVKKQNSALRLVVWTSPSCLKWAPPYSKIHSEWSRSITWAQSGGGNRKSSEATLSAMRERTWLNPAFLEQWRMLKTGNRTVVYPDVTYMRVNIVISRCSSVCWHDIGTRMSHTVMSPWSIFRLCKGKRGEAPHRATVCFRCAEIHAEAEDKQNTSHSLIKS